MRHRSGHAFSTLLLQSFVALWLMLLPGTLPAQASELPTGQKSIYLVPADGKPLKIGEIVFRGDGPGRAFDVTLNAPEFGPEFLSMRPFQCLKAEKEMWCYLQYPYKLARRVEANDFTDLEYSLLFLFKKPTEFGINVSNGLYFPLALGADGTLSGALHEVNLEPLGVPQDDPSVRPITKMELTEGDPGSRAFARIEIR